MTGPANPSSRGLLIVAQTPRELLAGGPWIMLAQWADAGAELFGQSWISTPDELLDATEARAFAGMTSRTKDAGSPLRRRVPEPLVTLAKDVRLARRAQGNRTKVGPLPEGLSTPFVLQHHALFQRRGRYLADLLDVPLVVGVDSLQVREALSWGVKRPMWAGPLERTGELRILRDADLVTAVSTETGQMLAELLGEEKVVVVQNRTQLGWYEDVDPVAERRSLGIADEFVVGWAGSFRGFHALDVVIEAFEELLESVPSAILLLVGDGPERQRCEERCRHLGPDRVRFVGMQPFDAVPRLLGAMDVAVVGARAGEAFHYSPLKLQEYLAAGLPVVAPDTGQVSELLSEGYEELLYPPGDHRAMAAKLVSLARDLPRRRRLAAEMAELAASLGSAAEEMARVCERLEISPEWSQEPGTSGGAPSTPDGLPAPGT